MRSVSVTSWRGHRWLPVAVTFAAPMAFFLIDKLVALSAILERFATPSERTVSTVAAGLQLVLVEDLLVTTLFVSTLVLFVSTLVLFELACLVAAKIMTRRVRSRLAPALKIVGVCLRFVGVLALVVLTIAPFAADMLLLRARGIRFTTDLIGTYIRDHDQATALEVEPREIRLAIATCVGAGAFALVFAAVYLRWVDSPDELALAESKRLHSIAETESSSPSGQDDEEEDLGKASSPKPSPKINRPQHRSWAIAVAAWLGLFVVSSSITHATTPAITLNTSLNELFRNAFGFQFQRDGGVGTIDSAAYYLEPDTESYELFRNDVLFRKTTGFQGPTAFDVQVDDSDPPNVVVIAVESIRYLDSLYLAANTSAAKAMQSHNLTLTPQFDRWAKRGISFSNMWSSWQTSHSFEAILFGQPTYDIESGTGTSGGQRDLNLSGMPQFFKQKRYETVFTTGCRVDYDQWDVFLPSHGFETVIAMPEMKQIAERDYGASSGDWDYGARRGFNWGVHDDVSFAVVGDLMVNKTKQQAARVERGEKKQSFFLNHYTISSHNSFIMRPAWYDDVPLPDFSPLCEGWESECQLLQDYAKMRYFTDMELGKFLDRMDSEGILNDTIVLVVGDHGQGPEVGLPNSIAYQTAVTHVASMLIAQGRLGGHAGQVIEDTTHQYDLLNTLMDIVGVPADGFLQTGGVGRSLKRSVPFGQRNVYSNNPLKKMSVVRGHRRFVYDRTADDVGLFDTLHDHLEKLNLLPTVGEQEAATWKALRLAERQLNSYIKRRWEKKCLTQIECP